jgi:hypothetical protein
VAERSNAAVSKTVTGGSVRRGFKSLPLRSTRPNPAPLSGAPASPAGHAWSDWSAAMAWLSGSFRRRTIAQRSRRARRRLACRRRVRAGDVAHVQPQQRAAYTHVRTAPGIEEEPSGGDPNASLSADVNPRPSHRARVSYRVSRCEARTGPQLPVSLLPRRPPHEPSEATILRAQSKSAPGPVIVAPRNGRHQSAGPSTKPLPSASRVGQPPMPFALQAVYVVASEHDPLSLAKRLVGERPSDESDPAEGARRYTRGWMPY